MIGCSIARTAFPRQGAERKRIDVLLGAACLTPARGACHYFTVLAFQIAPTTWWWPPR
jgi:hypothetical protein